MINDTPERLGRFDYGNGNVHYAEAPAFISGQTEYVRADLHEALRAERDDARKDAEFFRQQFNDQVESREAAERLAGARVNTGCKDRNGQPIYIGDKVRYRLEGPHTKPEYWNPEYEVIFIPPAFTLKHIGGGKDGGSHDFKLRHGGGNGDLEIIERGPYHAALAEPAEEAEPDFAASIAEVIKEESLNEAACGWRPCTGCHETNEGYETGRYPYSTMFGCHVGHGCSECGGLGVVWEYWSKDTLDGMARDVATPPDASAIREALVEIANGCSGRVDRDHLACRIASVALAGCQAMSARELKPCPFCGGRAEVKKTLGAYHARCKEGCSDFYKDTETAAKAWNRRADLSSGYVILSPDEVRGIRDTLRYAREGFIVAGSMPLSDVDTVEIIDAAIRSLKGGRDAQ